MSDSEFPSSYFSEGDPGAQRFEPYESSQQQQPRRSSTGCWVWALLLGVGLMLLVCCGGGALIVRFGMQIITTQIEDQLADNAILKEQLGEIESFELDWSRSFADEDDDTFIYQVRGSKGQGRVTVKHITNDAGDEEILSAELRLSSGETFNLMPGQP